MPEILVNYEIIDTLINTRRRLLGLSQSQTGAFDYEEGEEWICSVHISHILSRRCLIVYNKSYVLTNEEVIYLFRDLGGEWQ